MLIRKVPFGTASYDQTLQLRRVYLRDPLGLAFTGQDRDDDRVQRHFAAYEADEMIGAAILVPPGPDRLARIRQMIVVPSRRGRGVGASLVGALEREAALLGARRIALHARDTAREFYRKLGYEPVGGAFIEVTIAHIRMEKRVPDPPEGAM